MYSKAYFNISKATVILGFISFLVGLVSYRPFGGVIHGLIIGVYALPIFVTGVYLYTVPGEKGKFCLIVALFQLVFSAASFVLFFLREYFLALWLQGASLLLITLLVLRTWDRFHPRFYFQKFIGVFSYSMGAFTLILYPLLKGVIALDLGIITLFYIAVGIIYAVNSLGIPYTYGVETRGSMAYLIVLSEFTVLILYYLSLTDLLLLSMLASYLFYLLLVRIETIGKWFTYVSKLRELSKPKHYNLLLAHIVSFAFFPITTILLYTGYITIVTFVHVLSFGFILPEVLGHGTLLLPIILQKKAKFSKLVYTLTPSAAIIAALRLILPEVKLVTALTGGMVPVLLLIMLCAVFHWRKQ